MMSESMKTNIPPAGRYFLRTRSCNWLQDSVTQHVEELGANATVYKPSFDDINEGSLPSSPTSPSFSEMGQGTWTGSGNSIPDFDVVQFKEFGLHFKTDSKRETESSLPRSHKRLTAKTHTMRTRSGNSIQDFDIQQFKDFGLSIKAYRDSVVDGGNVDRTDVRGPSIHAGKKGRYMRTQSGKSILEIDVVQFKEFGLKINTQRVSR